MFSCLVCRDRCVSFVGWWLLLVVGGCWLLFVFVVLKC